MPQMNTRVRTLDRPLKACTKRSHWTLCKSSPGALWRIRRSRSQTKTVQFQAHGVWVFAIPFCYRAWGFPAFITHALRDYDGCAVHCHGRLETIDMMYALNRARASIQTCNPVIYLTSQVTSIDTWSRGSTWRNSYGVPEMRRAAPEQAAFQETTRSEPFLRTEESSICT